MQSFWFNLKPFILCITLFLSSEINAVIFKNSDVLLHKIQREEEGYQEAIFQILIEIHEANRLLYPLYLENKKANIIIDNFIARSKPLLAQCEDCEGLAEELAQTKCEMEHALMKAEADHLKMKSLLTHALTIERRVFRPSCISQASNLYRKKEQLDRSLAEWPSIDHSDLSTGYAELTRTREHVSKGLANIKAYIQKKRLQKTTPSGQELAIELNTLILEIKQLERNLRNGVYVQGLLEQASLTFEFIQMSNPEPAEPPEGGF